MNINVTEMLQTDYFNNINWTAQKTLNVHLLEIKAILRINNEFIYTQMWHIMFELKLYSYNIEINILPTFCYGYPAVYLSFTRNQITEG